MRFSGGALGGGGCSCCGEGLSTERTRVEVGLTLIVCGSGSVTLGCVGLCQRKKKRKAGEGRGQYSPVNRHWIGVGRKESCAGGTWMAGG
jgi:hypothetical protein